MQSTQNAPQTPALPITDRIPTGHRTMPKGSSQYVKNARAVNGYLPIERLVIFNVLLCCIDVDICSYGLIGNMRTAALISSDDCSIDHLCWPSFDSPSIFIRLLDKDKGGHFEVSPTNDTTAKQSYNGNILVTKFLSELGVSHVTDFMPLPDPKTKNAPFYPWLIRRLQCVRGEVTFNVECFPAFDYARMKHTAKLVDDKHGKRVVFESLDCELNFELLWTIDATEEAPPPKITFGILLDFLADFRNRRTRTPWAAWSGRMCTYQSHGRSGCQSYLPYEPLSTLI